MVKKLTVLVELTFSDEGIQDVENVRLNVEEALNRHMQEAYLSPSHEESSVEDMRIGITYFK